MSDKAIKIHVSKAAQQRVLELLADEQSNDSKDYLRIYISGKNCDGFEYGVCFSEREESDVLAESDSPCPIVVDQPSKVFFYDCQLDWVDDDRGQGFLVSNPQQKKFRGKFYKRQAWLDYFSDNKPSATNRPN